MEQLNLVGVYTLGPENFPCALLEWEAQGRFLPVWLPPTEGAQLAARLESWTPRRPSAHEVIADLTARLGGVDSVAISDYHHGVFYAELVLLDDTRIDMRASDALLSAVVLDIPLYAEESVLRRCSLHLTPGDALDFFGLDIAEREDAAEAGQQPGEGADAFEQLMRELGMGESDFGDENGKP